MFILAASEPKTPTLAEQWVRDAIGSIPTEVELHSATADDTLSILARAFSLRLAFYQAIWELVCACELFPGSIESWRASVTWRTSHAAGGLQLDTVNSLFPGTVQRSMMAGAPPDRP